MTKRTLHDLSFTGWMLRLAALACVGFTVVNLVSTAPERCVLYGEHHAEDRGLAAIPLLFAGLACSPFFP